MDLSPLYRRLRKPWLLLRGALELFVSRGRLDRWLDRMGFFRFKSRHFKSVAELPGGISFVHHPGDEDIIDEIFRREVYGRPRIAEGDTLVDVGAHIGVFAVYAARKNRRGRILSVEPAPANLELLRENLRRNGPRTSGSSSGRSPAAPARAGSSRWGATPCSRCAPPRPGPCSPPWP